MARSPVGVLGVHRSSSTSDFCILSSELIAFVMGLKHSEEGDRMSRFLSFFFFPNPAVGSLILHAKQHLSQRVNLKSVQ